ncbi:MAG: hypothetical protein JJV99_10855 [Colwellia sp.]|nr:hypothetical protein [Colwellia sp.]
MPEKNSIVQVGGSVESALQGDYQINIKAILIEAWQLTLKSRLAINIGLLFSLLLGMLISFLVSDYFGGIESVLENPQKSMLLNIIVTIAIWPFIAGVEMMGVLHSIGIKSHAKMIFSFLQRANWVVLCALLTSILISFGFQLFIVPGIFLAITLSLTIPLVLEKKMPPIKAITLSIQALRFKFWSLFAIYFILLLLLVALFFPLALLLNSTLAPIGFIIFLFGITYLAPLFYNTKGILYREIFGVNLVTDEAISEFRQKTNEPNSKIKSDSDDTFSA